MIAIQQKNWVVFVKDASFFPFLYLPFTDREMPERRALSVARREAKRSEVQCQGEGALILNCTRSIKMKAKPYERLKIEWLIKVHLNIHSLKVHYVIHSLIPPFFCKPLGTIMFVGKLFLAKSFIWWNNWPNCLFIMTTWKLPPQWPKQHYNIVKHA